MSSYCFRCCQTMGLERKKAIYDICVEYGAVSSFCYHILIL